MDSVYLVFGFIENKIFMTKTNQNIFNVCLITKNKLKSLENTEFSYQI